MPATKAPKKRKGRAASQLTKLPPLPNAAKRLRSVPVRLEAAAEEASGEGSSALPAARLKLVCRTAQPVDLWGGVKLVHDLDSHRPKENTAVDYCHDYGDILGRCANYRVEEVEGLGSALVCDADVESLQAGDTAGQVLGRMTSERAPVPYEASIDWDLAEDGSIELLTEGKTTVNGIEIAAPAYIVRGWTTRQMAICPLGADSSTSAELMSRLSAELILKLSSGKQADEEEDKPAEEMTEEEETPAAQAEEETEEEAPAEGEEAEEEEAPAEGKQGKGTSPAGSPPPPATRGDGSLSREELRRFSARFGADAVDYLAEGLEYVEALEKHADKLAASAAAAAAKVADLEAKLAKASKANARGEAEPLSAGSPRTPAREVERYAHLGRLAAAAASPRFQPPASRN